MVEEQKLEGLGTHLPGNLGESITPDPEGRFHNPLRMKVIEMLIGLTPREKRVLQLRFGLQGGPSCTLKEVGMEIGRSPRTAGRIEKTALNKLKRKTPRAELEAILGQDNVKAFRDLLGTPEDQTLV